MGPKNDQFHSTMTAGSARDRIFFGLRQAPLMQAAAPATAYLRWLMA
jgi:hypothetical protein